MTVINSVGPISSITVLGQTIVVINDARIAFDLLDKRSNIYSSRPRMIFAGEMYSTTGSLTPPVINGLMVQGRMGAFPRDAAVL